MFTGLDGQPLEPDKITDEFCRLAAECGLPPIRLHDLRHGAATLARAVGVDIKVFQEMLGHSSSVITSNTYTSVLPEASRQAAEAIAALLANAGIAIPEHVENVPPVRQGLTGTPHKGRANHGKHKRPGQRPGYV